MDHWEKISAVSKMQVYIDEHITEPITLRMLASAAGYSPWHSTRIFKELLGQTPFEYIRALRLSLAAVKLKEKEVKVTDVAFEFVFDSHEGFTRAFTKHFGVNPRSFCKEAPPIQLFMPSRVRDYYLTLQKGEDTMSSPSNVNTVFVQVVDRPPRKLILKRGQHATHYFEYCEETGSDVWDTLTSIQEALYEPIGMWLPEGLRKPGTSVYAQGVEVSEHYSGKVPEGFEIIDLPACQMMVFQGPPFEDERFEQAIGDLWNVMKSYNPQIYGFEWADEDGPRFQLVPQGYRGYIEARPVKACNKG
ncbi:AraC family transcriptional regulator [Paenibacillus turpanensis]|uniref:AraC family transcriptional regulator n=1 Tax=Paenibacillus turpanensis TaxID=2689078 RepID=UPI00140C5271|nr:AraC family transcriptional regulator [Paenibacillus turpanensis]